MSTGNKVVFTDLKGGFRLGYKKRSTLVFLLAPVIWIGKPAPVMVLETVGYFKIDSDEQ
jgi:hypothetical protein